jgi:short subunit dehydrogenase-like uncharacterized protein
MSDPLLIYGAAGHTGQLVTREALASGIRPVLAARSVASVQALAARSGLEYRVAAVHSAAELSAALEGIAVVVNVAGPFSGTAIPLLEACLRTGTHYLDLCAEVGVLEALARRHAEARTRGIMVMPAVGFDVVPSDCLAAHVAGRLPNATRLALGISGLDVATRGSAKTLVEQAGAGVRVRRDGRIETVAPGSAARDFDYGAGPRTSLNVSWGDVVTAYYTTGVADIEVYFDTTPQLRTMVMADRLWGRWLSGSLWQTLLKAQADLLPSTPPSEGHERTAVIVAEMQNGRGHRAISRLRTPEAYRLSGMTAATIAQRALRGDLEIGFQTPARVYGADFILSFPGVAREDLA